MLWVGPQGGWAVRGVVPLARNKRRVGRDLERNDEQLFYTGSFFCRSVAVSTDAVWVSLGIGLEPRVLEKTEWKGSPFHSNL